MTILNILNYLAQLFQKIDSIKGYESSWR